jgi:hypothetical protein
MIIRERVKIPFSNSNISIRLKEPIAVNYKNTPLASGVLKSRGFALNPKIEEKREVLSLKIVRLCLERIV